MMACTVGLFGNGRLGSLVAATIRQRDDLDCRWQLGRGQRLTDLPTVDVAIDVSHADAVPAHLSWSADTGTDLVIGATGWPQSDLEGFHGQGGVGVLIAPNFSLSMALLGRFATILGGYAARSADSVDLAVAETHHRAKVDAPSGSAAMLAAALAQGSGREPGQIPTTSLRMGSVVGHHEVRYESATEAMALAHHAHDRAIFADGAVAAALWLRGRHGIFTLEDWAAEQLDDLFAPRNLTTTHPTTTPFAAPAHPTTTQLTAATHLTTAQFAAPSQSLQEQR